MMFESDSVDYVNGSSNNKPTRNTSGISTFVMMPLDFGQDHGWLSNNGALNHALRSIKQAGVHGVMVDVWWGLCERQPQSYDFEKYIWLANVCSHHALKLQAVMAFHSCGDNVGDSVHVPLPHWASSAADEHGAWYLERSQQYSAENRSINREYISLGADHHAFLPGLKTKRTPIEVYAQFVEAFCNEMAKNGHAASTLTEIQVGLGPCGEARYPSYQLRDGKWRFPGIGELQCFDKFLLASLSAAAERVGHPKEWGVPPTDTGNYNSKVEEAPFYNGGHRTPRGRFFFQWYSQTLVQHVDDVLSAVAKSAQSIDLQVAVKVSGIHWGYLTSARAPECNAGYLVNSTFCFYNEICALLSRHDAILDFTCLEMASEDQPEFARAAPKQLVHDVFEVAARNEILVSGENALECYDVDSFNRVADSFRWSRAIGHSFTLLRLTETLLEHNNLNNLRCLTNNLRHVQ